MYYYRNVTDIVVIAYGAGSAAAKAAEAIGSTALDLGAAAIDRTVAVQNQVNVFAECTSLLRIMAGKTIEIVQ